MFFQIFYKERIFLQQKKKSGGGKFIVFKRELHKNLREKYISEAQRKGRGKN